MNDNESLTVSKPGATAALFRQASDAAGVCKEIVLKTACTISGRKYVKVEGWMAIAAVHGCIASIKSVEQTPNGIKAVAEIRRGDQVLTAAEGYVGNDEATWYGGTISKWDSIKRQQVEVTLPKRADYAIRAMAQTRALSRACRTAFAHVVVLMNEGLETVPAEEVDDSIQVDVTQVPPEPKKDGESREPQPIGGAMKGAAEVLKQAGGAQTPTNPVPEVPRDETLKLREQFRGNKWEKVRMHYGKNKDKTLGELLEAKSLGWYIENWQPKPYGDRGISEDDKLLRAALDVASEELAK